MKKETLRMERITCIENGVAMLNNFNFQIFTGEIMGIIPLDSFGIDTLINCLQFNSELFYGWVYIKEKLVNSYSMDIRNKNKVFVISDKSILVDSLSAAENVFILRKGLNSIFVNKKVCEDQLERLIQELNIEIDIHKPVKEMKRIEKYIIEIIKATINNADLIVLRIPGSSISFSDQKVLNKVLKFFSEQGVSFLYIGIYQEELSRVCDRISFMSKGSIIKILEKENYDQKIISSKGITKWFIEEDTPKKLETNNDIVFELKNVNHNSIKNLSFKIHKGERILIRHYGNINSRDILDIICENKYENGEILLNNKIYSSKDKRKIAAILENPVETMLFKDISYEDNLCISVDHRIKGIWRSKKKKNAIVHEIAENIPDKSIKVKDLSIIQKYELVYNRILLQRPDIVFCFYPYRNTDIELCNYIETLLNRFADNNIAVVIVTVDFQREELIADRIMLISDSGKCTEINRK